MAASRWLLMTFSLNKTLLGETGCLSNRYFLLTSCLDLVFLFTLFPTQSVRLLWLSTPNCAGRL